MNHVDLKKLFGNRIKVTNSSKPAHYSSTHANHSFFTKCLYLFAELYASLTDLLLSFLIICAVMLQYDKVILNVNSSWETSTAHLRCLKNMYWVQNNLIAY